MVDCTRALLFAVNSRVLFCADRHQNAVCKTAHTHSCVNNAHLAKSKGRGASRYLVQAAPVHCPACAVLAGCMGVSGGGRVLPCAAVSAPCCGAVGAFRPVIRHMRRAGVGSTVLSRNVLNCYLSAYAVGTRLLKRPCGGIAFRPVLALLCLLLLHKLSAPVFKLSDFFFMFVISALVFATGQSLLSWLVMIDGILMEME